MSYLGMFKTVARTELKELVPDVSDDTLRYLNKAITAAYDLRNKELSDLRDKVAELESFIIKISNTVDNYFHGLHHGDGVLHDLNALLSKHPIRKERSDVNNNTRKV